MIHTHYASDLDQLAALAAPFPPECHKQREEAGKTFTYLEHTTVAERLREVIGSGLTIRYGQVIHDPTIDVNDPTYGYVDMECIIEATVREQQEAYSEERFDSWHNGGSGQAYRDWMGEWSQDLEEVEICAPDPIEVSVLDCANQIRDLPDHP